MRNKNHEVKSTEELVMTGAEMATDKATTIDGSALFAHIASIIDNRKSRAESHVSTEITLMYWEIGQHISSEVLDNERGGYGRQVVATLAQQLTVRYGNSFEVKNLRRMIQFAKRFSDPEIVVPLARQLSWSHIIALLPIESDEAFLYYANDAAERRLGKRELRHQISRKAYERREIANSNLTDKSSVPFNVLKDPYILDTLGLKENFKESDLETAILTELEAFILEFGHGLTFVGRQKRFTFDGVDYYPDLLFFHRDLRCLIVIELKLGAFKAEYKGQMEMYLKWLSCYERREGENAPIGLILCTKASRKQVELLELDRAGIAVSEYWTVLPPKAELERKINEIMREAKERLERRKSLPLTAANKPIDYFYEPKDDVDD